MSCLRRLFDLFLIPCTFTLLPSFALSAGQTGNEPPPDSLTPIASSIQSANVEIELEGRKLSISLDYACQGSTVFLLPVWATTGQVKLLSGNGDERTCKWEAPLFKGMDSEPVRMRLQLTNLLGDEKTRKAVYARLKEEVAQTKGLKTEAMRLECPHLAPKAYRVTLCASGTGKNTPTVVPLSHTIQIPPVAAQRSEQIFLELLPTNILLLESDKGRPLTLPDVYLRIEGALKARFEKLQVQASLTVVRQAMTNLQNHLRSLTPSTGEAPEAMVYVPQGGDVTQINSASGMLTQYVIATFNVREGAAWDQGAIKQLTERVLDKALQQLQLQDRDEKKRVAFLLGNQATISATLGEIKTLCRQTHAEREQKLTNAFDDWEARQTGKTTEYKGSLGVALVTHFLPIGAKLEGDVKKKLEKQHVWQRKENLETVNRGLDDIKKHLDGRIPTLSGIQFDQKSLVESVSQMDVELKQNTFKDVWSQYEWPPVRLFNLASEAFDPQLLTQQLGQARLRYETFKGDLERLSERLIEFNEARNSLRKEMMQQLAELKAGQTRANHLEKELKMLQTALTRASELEKKLRSIVGDRDGHVRLVEVLNKLQKNQETSQELTNEALDRHLYAEVSRKRTSESVQQYLARAPLKTMKKEAETFGDFLTKSDAKVKLEMEIAEIRWGDKCWEGKNQLAVWLGKDLLVPWDKVSLDSSQGTKSEGKDKTIVSAPFASKATDKAKIGVQIWFEGSGLIPRPGSQGFAEEERSLRDWDNDGRGRTLVLEKNQIQVDIRIRGVQQEPPLPEWGEKSASRKKSSRGVE